MAEWSNGRMDTYLLHLWYMPTTMMMTTTTKTDLDMAGNDGEVSMTTMRWGRE
jgi:hypothetical protein